MGSVADYVAEILHDDVTLNHHHIMVKQTISPSDMNRSVQYLKNRQKLAPNRLLVILDGVPF